MTSRPALCAALAALILATAATPRPAIARGLFEALFGGPVERRGEFPERPRRKLQQQQRQQPRSAAKISAPSYNTYKADSLTRIALPLDQSPQPAAFTPGVDFQTAAALLGDTAPEAERSVADAVSRFYGRSRTLLWSKSGQPSAKAIAVQTVLADAATHGLDPADYAVSTPPGGTADPAAWLRFDLALSARALRYISDAKRGRVLPNRISGYYDIPERALDMDVELRILAAADAADRYLLSRHPDNAHYRTLVAELEALRRSTEESVTVDAALLLKPGQSHPDLPNLLKLIARKATAEFKSEFGPVLSAYASGEVYSPSLVPAIKAAQKMVGLGSDGVIGPRTVAAFAGQTVAERIAKVEVALEQLRWLPADFGPRHVFINQPAFTATYVEERRPKLSMRVVVGSPSNQTSFFYDEIEQVDYNPYWGVPQSIIVNEMMPRLRNDPGYLDRAGYEVTDAKGRRVPSSAVNWGAYGSKVPFSVRQAPSEANALGELKILFPNKHAIYMHDTPQKKFFERDARALSHGCIRLHDPRGMAAAVLGVPLEHVAAKIERGHSSEKLKQKVPVYVAYFTAWPNEAGAVEFFMDVYGRDARVMKAIETTESVRQAAS